MNYRTVISFGPKNISKLIDNYNKMLEEPKKSAVRFAYIAGVFFGYGYFIRFAFMGGVFYIGTLIVVETGINISDAFMSIFLCYMSTVGAGILLSNAPNISRA